MKAIFNRLKGAYGISMVVTGNVSQKHFIQTDQVSLAASGSQLMIFFSK